MPVAGTDFDRGLALHQQGRLAEAEPLYRRVLRTAPTHFDALHLLGVICGQTDRFTEALGLIKRALLQRPDSASVFVNLGNTLGNLGRHEEALQAFDRAIELRPQDAKALRNRGTTLRALERPQEALESFDRALTLKPDYPEAVVGRAESLLTLHRKAAAIEAFRQALALGHNTDQIRYALASLGAEPMPDTAPAGYVEALFDMYSHNFDQHLVEKLGYRTPALLVEALRQARPPEPADVIDVGCGTGLCGRLLRPLARRLVGVDLSGQMLAKARELGCYDELIQGDLVTTLTAQAQSLDVVVAADVFVYIGDLAAVFAATAAALRPGGLFAFSVEAGEAADFSLGRTRRYAHAPAYLQRLADAHGLQVEALQRSALRRESDDEVAGLLLVLRRISPSGDGVA